MNRNPPSALIYCIYMGSMSKGKEKVLNGKSKAFYISNSLKKSKVSWKKSHFSPLKFSTRFSISHEIGWQIDVWENIVRLPYWGRLSCFPDNGRRSSLFSGPSPWTQINYFAMDINALMGERGEIQAFHSSFQSLPPTLISVWQSYRIFIGPKRLLDFSGDLIHSWRSVV